MADGALSGVGLAAWLAGAAVQAKTKMILCTNGLPVHHRSVAYSFWQTCACTKKHIILTVDGQNIAPLKYTSGTATKKKHNTQTSPRPSGFNIGERFHDATSKDKHGQQKNNCNTDNNIEHGGRRGDQQRRISRREHAMICAEKQNLS